jgi:hypothetical protein
MEECGVLGLVKIQRETAVADVNELPSDRRDESMKTVG